MSKRKSVLQKIGFLLYAYDDSGCFHQYYTTRQENPLKKMQSLIAVACKLIRIFYVIMTKGVTYEPQRMLKDIQRPEVTAA